MRGREFGLIHVEVMITINLNIFERFALFLVVSLEFFQNFGRIVISALITLDDFQVAFQVVSDYFAVFFNIESYNQR